jgi:pyruvate dehydrogenase E1 component alpha subunit
MYAGYTGLTSSSHDELPSGMTVELALQIHRDLVLLRVFDERALVYHRHGRIGTWAVSWGHEAIQVGAMRALQPRDWAFPSYRENKISLLRGLSPARVLAGCRGQPEGFYDPRELRIGAISIPVASQVPHAVGFAWGERLQRRPVVALVFFGDGATSEGEFHEGANFAAVMSAPVVLLCCNNQWAISTPIHKQTRTLALADKAPGYGMPGVTVDGNDVLAVFSAVRVAADRARVGAGPTLVECRIYRSRQHAFPDNPADYRDEAEAALASQDDCVKRFEHLLLTNGLLDGRTIAQVREEALDRMAEAIVECEAFPAPDPSLVFQHTFERPTAAMENDLVTLRRVLEP